MRKRLLFCSVILFVIVAWLSAGCTVARKPAPAPTRPDNVPAPTAPAPARTLPTQPAEANRLAARIASEAEKVPGVEKATVVLTGNTVIVGLDIKAGVEKDRTNDIKKEVARRVKGADDRIRAVQVTTDPDIVTRIRKIAEGISKGTPVSTFSREVQEILRRIAPATR